MINGLGQCKVVSASTSIIATAARILGVSIKAGTDTATVKLLDGADSAGTQKTITLSVTSVATPIHYEFGNGIQCATGIYATITGTSPEVAVEFEG
jgi:hypothetical protein